MSEKEYDKITIDELKLFVGTGLKFHIYDCGEVSVERFTDLGTRFSEGFSTDCGDFYMFQTGTDCKPIVIPMSKITDSDAEWIEFVTGVSLVAVFKIEIQKIRERELNYKEMCLLAHYHYDLFGWLDKKGADRMPLAIEKEE